MKKPWIILNKKEYNRRLLVLNQELSMITDQEKRQLELIKKELDQRDNGSISIGLLLQINAEIEKVTMLADKKRRAAIWWFRWYPIICRAVIVAIGFIIGHIIYKLLN